MARHRRAERIVLSLVVTTDETAHWNGLSRCVWGRLVIKLLLLACVSLLHAFVLVGSGSAQSIDAARTAYAEGRFLEAADIGEALGTSEGLALAAESLTIQAYYRTRGSAKEALFERAAGLAQRAIKADPNNPEAHFQSSHVMGRHGQTIGVLEAANKGYAEKIRDAIETTLRLDPDMPAAYLGMAMWHAEVVAGVGSFMAGILYGADEDDAIDFYEQALVRAPDEKAVPLEYALGLLTLDDDDYREKARTLLQRAIESPVKDAFDEILHRKAIRRLAALDSRAD